MWIRYAPVVLACLTLGLAPFVPEPHLVGKLRWIAGGAVGMGPMDWFDALMHGAPWLLLIGMGLYDVIRLLLLRSSQEHETSGHRREQDDPT